MEFSGIVESLKTEQITQLFDIVLKTYTNEGTIYACGNGGNVGLLDNFCADLNLHPFVSDNKDQQTQTRNKFRVINLCNNPSMISALANDLGVEHIYSSQLFSATSEDVLLAITGSGTSKNVVKAIEEANRRGMTVVVFTRHLYSPAAANGDLVFVTPNTLSNFPGNTGGNNNNFYMEDSFCMITHIITGLLREAVTTK